MQYNLRKHKREVKTGNIQKVEDGKESTRENNPDPKEQPSEKKAIRTFATVEEEMRRRRFLEEQNKEKFETDIKDKGNFLKTSVPACNDLFSRRRSEFRQNKIGQESEQPFSESKYSDFNPWKHLESIHSECSREKREKELILNKTFGGYSSFSKSFSNNDYNPENFEMERQSPRINSPICDSRASSSTSFYVDSQTNHDYDGEICQSRPMEYSGYLTPEPGSKQRSVFDLKPANSQQQQEEGVKPKTGLVSGLTVNPSTPTKAQRQKLLQQLSPLQIHILKKKQEEREQLAGLIRSQEEEEKRKKEKNRRIMLAEIELDKKADKFKNFPFGTPVGTSTPFSRSLSKFNSSKYLGEKKQSSLLDQGFKQQPLKEYSFEMERQSPRINSPICDSRASTSTSFQNLQTNCDYDGETHDRSQRLLKTVSDFDFIIRRLLISRQQKNATTSAATPMVSTVSTRSQADETDLMVEKEIKSKQTQKEKEPAGATTTSPIILTTPARYHQLYTPPITPSPAAVVNGLTTPSALSETPLTAKAKITIQITSGGTFFTDTAITTDLDAIKKTQLQAEKNDTKLDVISEDVQNLSQQSLGAKLEEAETERSKSEEGSLTIETQKNEVVNTILSTKPVTIATPPLGTTTTTTTEAQPTVVTITPTATTNTDEDTNEIDEENVGSNDANATPLQQQEAQQGKSDDNIVWWVAVPILVVIFIALFVCSLYLLSKTKKEKESSIT